jgi:hypothetical protein
MPRSRSSSRGRASRLTWPEGSAPTRMRSPRRVSPGGAARVALAVQRLVVLVRHHATSSGYAAALAYDLKEYRGCARIPLGIAVGEWPFSPRAPGAAWSMPTSWMSALVVT